MGNKAPMTFYGIDWATDYYAQRPNRGNSGSILFANDFRTFQVYDNNAARWLPLEYIPFVYDFALSGGTAGDISLTDAAGTAIVIPANTIVLDGLLHVITAVTSAGSATIAIKVEATNDILVPTGKASFTTGALLDIVPDGTAAKAVRATVARTLTATVGTAALTAGKFYGFLRCLRSLAT